MTRPDREIRFTLTEQDYINAVRLQIRGSWMTTKSKVMVTVFALAALTALGFLFFGRHLMSDATESIVIGGLIGGLFVFVTMPMVAYHILLPQRVRKVFAQQVNLHGEMTARWTDETLFIGNSSGSGTIAWARYYGWSEDEQIVIVLQSQALFQMLPKHAMTPAQIEDMRKAAFAAGIVKR